MLDFAVLFRLAATALLLLRSYLGHREHGKGCSENLPSGDLPNLVGKLYGLFDLAIAEASLSSFGDVVLDTRHAITAQSGAKRHEFPFSAKISGPLPDRIDIQVEVPAVRHKELSASTSSESSAIIRERVGRARQTQRQRFHDRKIFCNAQMGARDLKRFCATEPRAEQLLERAMAKLGLSARA